MHRINIAEIRREYRLAELDEETAGDNPLVFFSQWFAEAQTSEITESNAMVLATVDAQQKPHARVVLLKGLDDKGFVFYTNYNSAKGQDLAANPNAALTFFWKELERQVRIEGMIEQISAEESDVYFNSRPEGSRIGAWSSPQSQVISGREVLEQQYAQYLKQFSGDIPRPAHWGGYRVVPEMIEFWQGRSSRLHDRIVFKKQGDGWAKYRLAP